MRQVLGKQVLDEESTADNGQRKHGKTGGNQPEQQRFHGLQRWQTGGEPTGLMVVQAPVLNGHDAGLDGAQRQQPVGDKRQEYVRLQRPVQLRYR